MNHVLGLLTEYGIVFSKSATELRPKLPALLEDAAMLYLRIGTCRLNNMAPEKWLRYVIEHI